MKDCKGRNKKRKKEEEQEAEQERIQKKKLMKRGVWGKKANPVKLQESCIFVFPYKRGSPKHSKTKSQTKKVTVR